MNEIEIIDVAPRGGLQNQPANLSTLDKLTLISRLCAAGARLIEVSSFVNPRLMPQMADGGAVLSGFAKPPGVIRVGPFPALADNAPVRRDARDGSVK